MSQIESFLETSKVKPTTVISCIASRKGGVTDSWDVEYTLNKFFLNLCKRVGINRFILLSAICVQKPTLEFQKAKLAFETLLKNSTLEYEIIRPTAFFKSLSGQIDRVKKGKSFLIFGNGCLQNVQFVQRSLIPFNSLTYASFLAIKFRIVLTASYFC